MNEAEVAPDPQLMKYMRAVGYELEPAIADVNSITTTARRVDAHFSASQAPYVAILENACGMADGRLFESSRHAGSICMEHRTAGDLGRFDEGRLSARAV